MRDFQVRNQHTLCEPLTARVVSVLNVTGSTPRRNLRYRRNENSCYGHLVAQYLPVRYVTHNHGATRVGWRGKKLTDATAAVRTAALSCLFFESRDSRGVLFRVIFAFRNKRSWLNFDQYEPSTLSLSDEPSRLCRIAVFLVKPAFLFESWRHH